MTARFRVATALVVLAAGAPATAPALAAPSDLDPAFSGDGWATADFGKWDFASGVALQDDDRVVVAGTTFEVFCEDIWCDTPAQFALARFAADGGLDLSFSGDGMQTTDFGGSDNGAYDTAVQADGRIVAVGHAGGGDFALARYNTDGSLDKSFAGDGKAVTDFGEPRYGTDFGAYDVVLQRDDKIVVAGRTGAGDFAVARYHSDGSLDTSFSEDGKASTDLGGFDYGRALAVQGDGKIVVAGGSYVGGDGDFALSRYNPDGSLDHSFSGDGKEVTDFGDRHDGLAVAMQSDGRIVVAGSVDGVDGGDFAVARYNQDGSLDGSFGDGGRRATDFGGDDYGRTVAVQPDGRIIVAGPSAGDFALARYDVDGTPDAVFGGDGKVTTDFGGLDEASDIALYPDGRIAAVGRRDYDILAARYVGGTGEATPGAIGGSVRDSRTGAAIAGAGVDCGDGLLATTASDGRYAIADVAAGSHSCTARAKRYHSSTRTVSVTSGQTATLDFALRRRSS